jgi:cell division septal protein FtsQ
MKIMKMKKTHRLRNQIILYLALALVLSSTVWAGLWLVNRKEFHFLTGVFHIETVHVEGVSAGRAADVRTILKKQTNLSLHELNLETIQDALIPLRWVKEVRLRKEWPDALVIKLTERTPFVWVENRMPGGSEKGRYRLVDDDGVEMDSLGHPAAGFPVIRLTSASNIPDPDQTGLKAGIHVLQALAVSGVEPEDLTDIAVEVRDAQDVMLRYKGLPLRLGFGDPNEQLRRFMVLKPELLAKAPEISEVDLRFPGRLIVRSKLEVRTKKYRAATQTDLVEETRRVAEIKDERR